MKRIILKIVILCVFIISKPATVQNFADVNFITGYVKSLAGSTREEKLLLPEASIGIIIRAFHKNTFIEWQSDTVRENYKSKKVTFVWFGVYSWRNSEIPITFNLFCNDNFMNSFESASAKNGDWTVKNNL